MHTMLTKDRLDQLFRNLFGITVSTGTTGAADYFRQCCAQNYKGNTPTPENIQITKQSLEAALIYHSYHPKGISRQTMQEARNKARRLNCYSLTVDMLTVIRGIPITDPNPVPPAPSPNTLSAAQLAALASLTPEQIRRLAAYAEMLPKQWT